MCSPVENRLSSYPIHALVHHAHRRKYSNFPVKNINELSAISVSVSQTPYVFFSLARHNTSYWNGQMLSVALIDMETLETATLQLLILFSKFSLLYL